MVVVRVTEVVDKFVSLSDKFAPRRDVVIVAGVVTTIVREVVLENIVVVTELVMVELLAV